MSNVEEMLNQLIKDAEKTDASSEAVLFFKKIMQTTNIDVSSQLIDSKCSKNNTVFENFDNPEYVFNALESIDSINIGEAIDLGLSDNADIENELTGILSLKFTKNECFSFEDNFKHTMLFKRCNFTFIPETSINGHKLEKSEKTPVLEVLYEVFDGEVLQRDLKTLNIVLNEVVYADDVVVSVDFEGKEYVVKDLIRNAMLDSRLVIEEEMLP